MKNLLEQYRESKDFIVNSNEEYGLHSVKYAHNNIDWSNPIALQARGIVLDDDGAIVARPYNKFFNLNELKGTEFSVLSEWIDGMKHTIETKEDGSLAIFFQHKGEVLAASSGVVMGEYAKLFLKTLNNNVDTSKEKVFNRLTEENTIICEYVAPTNRIVLNYEEEELILHGIIHTKTGRVYGREWTESIANYLGLRVVRRWNYFTKEDLEILQKNEKGVEGYVVKFSNGHALKIKTADYIEKHKGATIFFGRVDTKNKVKMYSEALFSNTFDDILGLCESNVLREYLREIQNCYYFYLRNREKVQSIYDEGVTKSEYFRNETKYERSFVRDQIVPIVFDGDDNQKFQKFVTSALVAEFANQFGGATDE